MPIARESRVSAGFAGYQAISPWRDRDVLKKNESVPPGALRRRW